MQPEWLASLRPSEAPIKAPFCNGASIAVWHARVDLLPWDPPEGAILSGTDNWNGKPLVIGHDSRLDRSVGEVEVAARLRADGARSAWTGKPRAPWSHFALSGATDTAWLRDVDAEIRHGDPLLQRNGRGTPDVLRWVEGRADFCCVEYKGPSPTAPLRSDTVKIEQTAWVASAVLTGLLTPDRIAVVTWRPSIAAAAILKRQAEASKRGKALRNPAQAT